MAGPTDLDKQIESVRDSMESSIVVLRARGKREVRRIQTIVIIAGGVGAAVSAVLLGATIVHHLRRPPTRRERIERLIPLGWWDRLSAGFSKQVPPMRLYIGDRQIGEEGPHWEQVAVRVAGTLGRAAGTAAASRLLWVVLQRVRDRAERLTES